MKMKIHERPKSKNEWAENRISIRTIILSMLLLFCSILCVALCFNAFPFYFGCFSFRRILSSSSFSFAASRRFMTIIIFYFIFYYIIYLFFFRSLLFNLWLCGLCDVVWVFPFLCSSQLCFVQAVWALLAFPGAVCCMQSAYDFHGFRTRTRIKKPQTTISSVIGPKILVFLFRICRVVEQLFFSVFHRRSPLAMVLYTKTQLDSEFFIGHFLVDRHWNIVPKTFFFL